MEEKKEESCKCGDDCSCDSGCGRGCCCAKALIVALVFLVGGVIGYLIGQGGMCKKMMKNCPMGMGGPAVSAPVTPGK